MFKKIALTIVGLVIAGSLLTACGNVTSDVKHEDNTDSIVEVPQSDDDFGGGSGIGMTYGGKTGFDMGGGLILPFDGSGMELGFGF